MSKSKFNVYDHVTETVLTELEAGVLPWRQPWPSGQGGLQIPRRVNGEHYRGINVVMLSIAAQQRGYSASNWMTYRQAQELGGQVRRREKSTTVIKYGTLQSESNEEDEAQTRSYARAYRVFNCSQIDGLDPKWYDHPVPPKDFGTESDPKLDRWFAGLGIDIHHTDEPAAYYAPVTDQIHMPLVSMFKTPAGYYDVLAHEASHAVANKRRLALTFSGDTAKERYAYEEIYAELVGAVVCARHGIELTPSQNAAYIDHWIKLLKEDNRALIRAASKAQLAADWMFEQTRQTGRYEVSLQSAA